MELWVVKYIQNEVMEKKGDLNELRGELFAAFTIVEDERDFYKSKVKHYEKVFGKIQKYFTNSKHEEYIRVLFENNSIEL